MDAGPEAPTYYQDVYPILAEHCYQCHLNGPSTYRPFFDSYEHVKQVSGLIALDTRTREMPPYALDASGACQEWEDRGRWLNDDELATLQAWSEAGAPEGDPDHPMEPEQTYEPLSLERVDAVADTGVEYSLDLGDRLHRCFPAQLDLAQQSFLTAFRVVPGDFRAVQHVSLFALDTAEAETAAQALVDEDPEPGYHCFSSPRVQDSRLLGTWVWGEQAFRFPDGTGVRIEPGRDVVIQIHYDALGGTLTPEPDRTKVELELSDSVREAWFESVQVPSLQLQPGQRYAQVSYVYPLAKPLEVYGVFPLLHSLGHGLTLRRTRSGGECLAETNHWDLYNHMQFYRYRDPIALDAGEGLDLSCSYDTTSRSQPVDQGEAYDQEQCEIFLYATDPP